METAVRFALKTRFLVLSLLCIGYIRCQSLDQYQLPEITASKNLVDAIDYNSYLVKNNSSDRKIKVHFYGQSIVSGINSDPITIFKGAENGSHEVQFQVTNGSLKGSHFIIYDPTKR